jgi:hypothetical protein
MMKCLTITFLYQPWKTTLLYVFDFCSIILLFLWIVLGLMNFHESVAKQYDGKRATPQCGYNVACTTNKYKVAYATNDLDIQHVFPHRNSSHATQFHAVV